MKNEISSMLRTDFLSFARKAIRRLEGTTLSRDRYLELLASELSAFADGATKRQLLVNLPPRHLKTLLGSVCLSAWILGHNPNTKIMLLACSANLAEKISRQIRAVMSEQWYQEIFPTRIKKGHAKAMDFETKEGGGVFASSINGIITGFGADIIIVDDPHDISDVRNPELLDATVETFESVVRSRLNNRKRPRILVIAHRIHDRDLSAHLLGQGNWAHVILPLVATRDQTYETDYGRWHRRKGELLQPEAEDEDEIARRKTLLVNPDFDMLYQQDCDGQARPPIKADDFPTFVPGHHADLHCVVSIDAGNTDGDDASFSVIQAWAFDDKNLYLMNQFREQCEFNELKRMTKRFIKRHRPDVVLIEKTANGPALISELRRKEKTRRLVLPITPRGSKAARLSRHIDKIRDGRVQLPENAVFNAEFGAEFERFHRRKHADQVDAFTQTADWFDQCHTLGRAPRRPSASVPMVVGYNSQFSGFDQGKSTTAKPAERGVCVVRGNSYYAPNGPFIKVTSG
jgi:predicted phage terminase large subunit-like protein